jgi:hypothetical protein
MLVKFGGGLIDTSDIIMISRLQALFDTENGIEGYWHTDELFKEIKNLELFPQVVEAHEDVSNNPNKPGIEYMINPMKIKSILPQDHGGFGTERQAKGGNAIIMFVQNQRLVVYETESELLKLIRRRNLRIINNQE